MHLYTFIIVYMISILTWTLTSLCCQPAHSLLSLLLLSFIIQYCDPDYDIITMLLIVPAHNLLIPTAPPPSRFLNIFLFYV